jgi:hypothetical protein
MIYTLLSITFGAAGLYLFAAERIQKKCFRVLTKEELKELNIEWDEDEEVRLFDATKAGRWLAVMAVCWWLGYPVIQIQKWLTK